MDGVPEHQAVVPVEVSPQLGHPAVLKVPGRLQGAVGEDFVLSLGQNQQAFPPCGHHLHMEHWTIKGGKRCIICKKMFNVGT